MNKKIGLIASLIFFLVVNGFSQNADSLWRVFNDNSRPDSVRLRAIESIVRQLTRSNPDSAIVLAKIEVELAEKINAKREMATAYSLMGAGYYFIGNYPQSLQSHTEALKLFEAINYKSGIASSHNNFGIIYYELKNYDNSLKELGTSLKLYKELNDSNKIASITGNLGSLYYSMNKLPEALKANMEALTLLRKNGASPYIIANALSNIGVVYQGLKNYPEALNYLLEALKIRQENKEELGIEISWTNLASLYAEQKDYKRAEEYAEKAITLATKQGDLEGVKEIQYILSEVYTATNRPEKALISYKEYIKAKDSLINEGNSRQIMQTQMQYEFEKKEALMKAEQVKKEEIAIAEGKRQNVILVFVSGILLLSTVFAVVTYRRFKLSQKQKLIIEQKERETQDQNKIILQQKYLVEEKHREITDSINYAERIQRSFMASEQKLNKHLHEYFILFKPKDVVSGDFYWASSLNNGNYALVTADSTGHGVPGAIMSLLNITSLEKAIETEVEPSKILNLARRIIIERLKNDGSTDGGKDGMDCSLCVFDYKSMRLIVAAANNPVWIVRGKDLIEIKPDKMPLGKHDKQDIPFTQHEISLQKGDVVYSITDGFPDQFGGEKGKKFMTKNLKRLLLSNAHLDMNAQKKLLELEFANWAKDIDQVDDVTVIGVKV